VKNDPIAVYDYPDSALHYDARGAYRKFDHWLSSRFWTNGESF